ncbi:MAG: metal ABC transporter permease [Patescibacteria group bacterium]
MILIPDVLQFDFMRRALAVGLIVAAVAPTIGLFFVVRRYSAIADTLAHVSLAGVAAALVAGTAAIPTAFLVSVASVLGIEHLREKKTLPPDTIVSLFLFGGLALGVVLLGFSHGRNVNIVNYLFGNILTVSQTDIISVAVIGGIAFLLTLLLWRQLFAVAIDEDSAEAAGIHVKTLNRVLSILGAATIAISMNVVGVLLIGALMVIPVLAAMQFRLGFHGTWRLSLIFSFLSVIFGLIASFYLNLASGGTIVLSAIICFMVASLVAGQQRGK